MRLVIGLMVMAIMTLGWVGSSPGQVLKTVAFDPTKLCDNQLTGTSYAPKRVGLGIAFDGSNLWYSCFFPWVTGVDLYRRNLTTDTTTSYSIAGGLGALAYDAARNAIWAGWSTWDSTQFGNIYFIQLDATTKDVKSSKVAFRAPDTVVSRFPGDTCSLHTDGVAYDPQDDTLYISGDCATTIHHYSTKGVLLDDRPWAGSACFNSGLAVLGGLLFQAAQTCNVIYVTDKVTNQLVQNLSNPFPNPFPTYTNGRDEDLEIAIINGQTAVWVRDEESSSVSASTIPQGLLALLAGTPPPPGGTPPPPGGTPPPPGGTPPPSGTSGTQGCSPGYWKQSKHFLNWKAPYYASSTRFFTVFGVHSSLDSMLLVAVLGQGGGGINALGRHVVGALLNAARLGATNFGLTDAQVISYFQGIDLSNASNVDAWSNYFESMEDVNGRNCPLN